MCLSRSAFGKLGELNKKSEDMQRLYLWQQQEASYMMLHDFSGRPQGDETTDGDGAEVTNFDPEMYVSSQ